MKGMKVSDANEKKPHLAVSYKNIGNVYSMFQDYEKGISLYLEGVKQAKESGDNETLYKLYQNLTGAYIYLNDTKTARHRLQSVATYKSFKNRCQSVYGWLYVGVVGQGRGQIVYAWHVCACPTFKVLAIIRSRP